MERIVDQILAKKVPSEGDILHKACYDGDAKIVQELVQTEVFKNTAPFDQIYALELAVRNSNAQVAEILLESGEFSSRMPGPVGIQMFQIACCMDNPEMFELMLRYGGDINAKNVLVAVGGHKLIHLAATAGKVRMVELLLLKGVTVDEVRKLNITPLHDAAKAGHIEVVKYLISAGANAKRRDIRNGTALHFACMSGNLEVVQFIALHTNINTRNNNNHTPLVIAASLGHADVVKFLAKESNMEDKSIALREAIHEGKTESVQILVANGADVNAAEYKQTPLHSAVLHNDPEIVKCLLEHGADVNAKDTRNYTPLVFACQNGQLEMVSMLVEKGAQIMPAALEVACLRKDTSVAEYLMQHGANVHDVKADRHYSANAVKILCRMGWNAPYIAYKIQTGHCDDKLAELVQSGKLDLNIRDERGYTAIHYAIYTGELDFAKILLTCGAKVEKEHDITIKSPLHALACDLNKSEARLEVAQLLLKHDIDINADFMENSLIRPHNVLSGSIVTPLILAIHARNTPIVELLLREGAEYSHLNKKGKQIITMWELCASGGKECEKYIEWMGFKWTPSNHKRHPKCVRQAIHW